MKSGCPISRPCLRPLARIALLIALPNEVRAHYPIGGAAALSRKHLERGEQSIELWISRPPDDATTATRSGAHYRLGMIHET